MVIVRWLRSNLGSIVLSLLVGLTIWVIVNQEQNPVRDADFPSEVRISVTGLGDGLVITNNPPGTARMHVRAPQNTWSGLTPDQFLVTADLSGMGPGTHLVTLHVDFTSRAAVSVTPDIVRYEIEELKTRELPIQTHLDGQMAIGWTAGQATMDPARVLATGPKSQVDLISEIRAAVQVQDVRQTIHKTVQLVALDPSGNVIKNVTLSPTEVDITLPLKQEAGYRDLVIYPNRVGEPHSGYYITGIRVVPGQITVRGDPQIVSAMQSYVETQPVNLTGLTSDLVEEVTLDLPPGVTPVDNTKIQMFVTIKALEGSHKFTPKVQIVGLGQGLTAKVTPETVDLILSGPVAILDTLDPDIDIIVTIDLTGMSPGTYNVEPKVHISHSEIAYESPFPGVISVTIK